MVSHGRGRRQARPELDDIRWSLNKGLMAGTAELADLLADILGRLDRLEQRLDAADAHTPDAVTEGGATW